MPSKLGSVETSARWREAILAWGRARLQRYASVYLGGSTKIQESGSVVSALAAFLGKPETQKAITGSMDEVDRLIVGYVRLAGEIESAALGKLVAEEMNSDELEYRLANLMERLILYRTIEGTVAMVPMLEPVIGPFTANPGLLFGTAEMGDSVARIGTSKSLQDLALIAYGLLRRDKAPFLASGVLSAKAKRWLDGLTSGDDRAQTLVAAFLRKLGFMDMDLAAEWIAGADFPFDFALGEIPELDSTRRKALARRLEPLFLRRCAVSGAGLKRFVGLALLKEGLTTSAERICAQLESAGLVDPDGSVYHCLPERIATRDGESRRRAERAMMIDGTGAVHVMPEAPARAVAALLDIGDLADTAGAWRIRISRESVRRAFDLGYTADSISRGLALLGGTPLPQAFTFNLASWAEEHSSVRLHKGAVLVLDKHAAPVFEGSKVLAAIPHQILAKGVYFFPTQEIRSVEKALADLGLPKPASGNPGCSEAREFPSPQAESRADTENQGPEATESLIDPGLLPQWIPPARLPDFRSELERLLPDPVQRKPYEDLLARKLVYTLDQLHAIVESGGTGRLDAGQSAGGLDFSGKVRLIQTALKARYQRLRIRWAISGEIRSALVRPISLARTEKDYLLVGECVEDGSPVSIRVGAMTQVIPLKGFHLGDE
jgi:hypothetical protein